MRAVRAPSFPRAALRSSHERDPPAPPTLRYKLLAPKPAYTPLFSGTQRKLDLCARAASALATSPQAPLVQALPSLLHPPEGPEQQLQQQYTFQDLQAEAGFVHDQLDTLFKVGGCGQGVRGLGGAGDWPACM